MPQLFVGKLKAKPTRLNSQTASFKKKPRISEAFYGYHPFGRTFEIMDTFSMGSVALE